MCTTTESAGGRVKEVYVLEKVNLFFDIRVYKPQSRNPNFRLVRVFCWKNCVTNFSLLKVCPRFLLSYPGRIRDQLLRDTFALTI